MAATQVLATGSTALSSSDVTVVAGTPQTLSLKGYTGPTARVLIELKDDAGAYNAVDELNSIQPGQATKVIVGPGVYRLTRIAGATCGVYVG